MLEDHVYADQAQSGARRDREGLGALVAAAQNEQFDVVLVDDLSRLARDNYLMLPVMAELLPARTKGPRLLGSPGRDAPARRSPERVPTGAVMPISPPRSSTSTDVVIDTDSLARFSPKM